MTEIIDFLKKYTDGKQNTEKVEISVLQLKRVIKALEKESRWIPVSERLPQTKEQVLCCEKDKVFIGCMVFEYDGVPVFNESNYKHFYVTAWMPLPSDYSEVEE